MKAIIIVILIIVLMIYYFIIDIVRFRQKQDELKQRVKIEIETSSLREHMKVANIENKKTRKKDVDSSKSTNERKNINENHNFGVFKSERVASYDLIDFANVPNFEVERNEMLNRPTKFAGDRNTSVSQIEPHRHNQEVFENNNNALFYDEMMELIDDSSCGDISHEEEEETVVYLLPINELFFFEKKFTNNEFQTILNKMGIMLKGIIISYGNLKFEIEKGKSIFELITAILMTNSKNFSVMKKINAPNTKNPIEKPSSNRACTWWKPGENNLIPGSKFDASNWWCIKCHYIRPSEGPLCWRCSKYDDDTCPCILRDNWERLERKKDDKLSRKTYRGSNVRILDKPYRGAYTMEDLTSGASRN